MMRPTILKSAFLGCSIFLFSILNCYGQEDPSDQLVGTWTKSVNGRTATITLASDNSYQVEFVGDKEIDVLGSFAVEGSEVTFNDEGGVYGAIGVPGVYAFNVDDSSVTFSVTDDSLAGRKILLEGKWSKTSGED